MVRHRQCAKRFLTANAAVAAAMIFAVLSIGGCEKTPTNSQNGKPIILPRPEPEITISLDLSLYVPDYSGMKTLLDEYNKPTLLDMGLKFIYPEVAFIRWLMRGDLKEKKNDGSGVYVIARVTESNRCYCDGAARTDVLGRKVSFAFKIPKKHLGKSVNFEIWQDNSDDSGLKTFFESIKAQVTEVGTQAGVNLPTGGGANARGKVSGTLEFDFANFSKVLDKKDGLLATLDFDTSGDGQPEKPVLDFKNKMTKAEVRECLRYKNKVDAFLSEAKQKGFFHEQVNTFFVPFGKARFDISGPIEE